MTKKLLAFAAAFALVAPQQAQAQTAVDLELALLVDVSGSVSGTEFALQRDGYVNFFNGTTSGSFWSDFNASNSTMAVSYMYWSSSTQQSWLSNDNSVWFHITSSADALAFASAIAGFSRPFSGTTSPGAAVLATLPTFGTDFLGSRQVIDVSGDGCQNSGTAAQSATNAQQAAANAGVTINGITIGGGSDCSPNTTAAFLAFYADQVATTDGFTLNASDFDDFAGAVSRKLVMEITDTPPGDTVPEPATMTLLATGLAGMAAARRRKQNKG